MSKKDIDIDIELIKILENYSDQCKVNLLNELIAEAVRMYEQGYDLEEFTRVMITLRNSLNGVEK